MAVQWTTNRQFTAPAAAAAVAVTPNASSWANSDYEELIASADADLVLTGLSIVTPGASEPFEVDIATGAAASETVITTFRGEYTNAGFAGNGYIPHVIPLDNIAAGSRVSCRMRKNGTSVTAWNFAITYLKKPIVGNLTTTANPQKAAPAAAVGVTIAGVVSPVWDNGAYQTVIASASADLVITGIVLPAMNASPQWECDLAVGAAAAEAVITTIHGSRTGSADGPSYVPLRNPLDAVPSGSRLAARLREADVTAARNLEIAVTYHELPL